MREFAERNVIVGDELHEYIGDKLICVSPLMKDAANLENGTYLNKTTKNEVVLRNKKPGKFIDGDNNRCWYPTYLVDSPLFKKGRYGLSAEHGLEPIERTNQTN